jgi:hypothetical protein
LDPIFERLRPPQFIGIPLTDFVNSNDTKTLGVEFSTLSSLGFDDYVYEMNRNRANDNLCRHLMSNFAGNYIMIRALADSNVSEDLRDAVVSNYPLAMTIFNAMNILMLRPLRNPLRCIESYPLVDLKDTHQFVKTRGIDDGKTTFPWEIGKLLMKKLTYYPESLDACKDLVSEYKEQDVCSLFGALNQGIMRNHPDVVEKNEKELSIVLDNIWKDKGFRRRITGIKIGVPLLLGAVGTVAAGLPGTFAGLLSAVGFNGLDKIFELNEEAFSKKIVKAISQNHQIIIFDFKKKYHLP